MTRGGQALTISDLVVDDGGTYKCLVEYPTGGGLGFATINIIGAPLPVSLHC